MDIAVGVRRPVVKHEFRPARGGRAHAAIEIDGRPARERFRLLLRQPGAHRKIRLRQIERFGIVAALSLRGRLRFIIHRILGLD